MMRQTRDGTEEEMTEVKVHEWALFQKLSLDSLYFFLDADA